MALSKSEREKCWSARDLLWNCMDEKQEKHQELCKEFRAQYEKNCPSQWVKHFDRKREYLKFKDAINNEGQEAAQKESHGYLSCESSAGQSSESENTRYGNHLTVLAPSQTNRSSSSLPGELNGKCDPGGSGRLSPDNNRTTLRVIRKFPSLSSI